LTEFGRTVKSNSAHGTEHGYGTAALLAGGLVTNPSVIADWPGLKKLHDDRDLKATIDYRSICAACIEVVFGLDHDEIAEKVFFDKATSKFKKICVRVILRLYVFEFMNVKIEICVSKQICF
jgi:uncharacterized protein (DUF1501 family)